RAAGRGAAPGALHSDPGAGELPGREREKRTSKTAEVPMTPFDLTGPEFLTLYAVVVGVAVVAGVLLRRSLRGPADPPLETPRLDPYEAAHLAGGATLAVNAAVARLVHADVLKLDESSGTLHRHGELPADAHPLEKAAYDANLEALTVRELRVAVAPEAAKIRERLEQLGLELPAEQASKARWWPVLLMLAVTAFGGVKILV